MTIWTLLQLIFNIVVTVFGLLALIRASRKPADDPRMSRGLQMLQSKISVLEDLSDRVETQSKQMIRLMEEKELQVKEAIDMAHAQIQQVENSIKKSVEVAKIFQDRIPHEEILERKNTIKYVEAAKMAHSGSSVKEISDRLGIPKAEAEFIVAVNKEEPRFNEANTPDWAKIKTEQILE
jgi:hypothetical protein